MTWKVQDTTVQAMPCLAMTWKVLPARLPMAQKNSGDHQATHAMHDHQATHAMQWKYIHRKKNLCLRIHQKIKKYQQSFTITTKNLITQHSWPTSQKSKHTFYILPHLTHRSNTSKLMHSQIQIPSKLHTHAIIMTQPHNIWMPKITTQKYDPTTQNTNRRTHNPKTDKPLYPFIQHSIK